MKAASRRAANPKAADRRAVRKAANPKADRRAAKRAASPKADRRAVRKAASLKASPKRKAVQNPTHRSLKWTTLRNKLFT